MDDLEGIKKLALAWNTGWNNSDVEALLALYVDEPVLLPQGQPAIIGKEAIRSAYHAEFKEFIINGEGKVVLMESSGDLGCYWSNYILTATPKNGTGAIISRGKSLFILKRQVENSWRIACLMDNSDEESAQGL